MITLADITPEQRARVCNGCGPRSWKYHIPTPNCSECCDAHDLAYWIGGTPEDRKAADRALYDCIRRDARQRWIGARLLALLEAWIFYRTVRRDGAAHWHPGNPDARIRLLRSPYPPLPPVGGTGRSP